jgi:hypothetical protein
MSPPRYRTLDGDEIELPLAMDHWVLVPRALARFDPELAWTLDHEDAPDPEAADPRLDYSAGALLVPLERWNEQAELEPNLAPSYRAPTSASGPPAPPTLHGTSGTSSDDADKRFRFRGVADVAARATVLALAALAITYVLAVGVWLWTLRDGISGPNVSTGLMLVGGAVLLAWLAGITGARWRPTASPRPGRRTWPELCGPVLHLTDDPLGILRAGLALQIAGFAVLVIVR